MLITALIIITMMVTVVTHDSFAVNQQYKHSYTLIRYISDSIFGTSAH